MTIEIKDEYAKEYCDLIESAVEGRINVIDLLKQLPLHHVHYLIKTKLVELKKERSS